MNNKLLFDNIKDLCLKNHYPISTLEDDINVSQGLISRWGKENGNPPLEKILEIAKLLNVSILDLIGEENQQNETSKEIENIIDKNALFINKLFNKKWHVYDNSKFRLEQFENVINEFIENNYCKSVEPYFIMEDYSYILLLAGYQNNNKVLCLYCLENENINMQKIIDSSDELMELWLSIRSRDGILEKLSTLLNRNLMNRILNE